MENKKNRVYDVYHIDTKVVLVSAPKKEPYQRICITVPDRILNRLEQYPGEQSWKIQMLVEYALALGALMSPEEAKHIAQDRAMTIAKQVGLEPMKKRA